MAAGSKIRLQSELVNGVLGLGCCPFIRVVVLVGRRGGAPGSPSALGTRDVSDGRVHARTSLAVRGAAQRKEVVDLLFLSRSSRRLRCV